MSRYTLVFIFLCLTFSAVSAQQLRADAEEKHFGEMRALDRRTVAFTLTNVAADTVFLGPPKPSCGCTATMLDRSVLAPGDSATVSVEFHAAPGMIGSIGKSVSIFGRFGGEERRFLVLRVRAEIVSDVKYEPGTLRFNAVVGDTVRLEATLRSNSDKAVRLENVTSSITAFVDTTEGNIYHVEHVQARPFTDLTITLQSAMLESGDSTRMIVTLIPRDKGQLNGSIQIPLPDNVLRIPLVGSVLRQRE